MTTAAGAHPDLLDRRADYPILGRRTYLINNSLGAMHRETRRRLDDYADLWDTEGVVAWHTWFPELTRVADLVGTAIGAAPGTTVLRANVADALASIASCFDLGGEGSAEARSGLAKLGRSARSGTLPAKARTRIVTTAADWPGTHYFWTEQVRRHGGELVVVPFEADGLTVSTERLVDAIDDRTLLVSVSLVQFRTSALLDLAPVVEAAHRHGALVLLDAYQAAGGLPVNMAVNDVDICVGGSVKFLCGGPGNGWLSVAPRLVETLRPAAIGWISHAAPFDFEWDEIRYAEGIGRFAGGTPNVPAAYAAAPGYQAIVDIGIDRIRERSMSLTQPLLEGALERGFAVRSPYDPRRRGGHVTIDPGNAKEVHDALLERKIVVDYRPGSGIRVAPHFYNTAEECVEVLDAMAELARR